MLPDARDQCSSLFVISGVNSSNGTPCDSNSAYLGMKFDLTRLQRSCLGARLRSLYCSSYTSTTLCRVIMQVFIIWYERVLLYRMLIECIPIGIILESNPAPLYLVTLHIVRGAGCQRPSVGIPCKKFITFKTRHALRIIFIEISSQNLIFGSQVLIRSLSLREGQPNEKS